ncbi:MAG: universal stress protein [Thermodesulfovibrionales bacterium]
MANYRKILVAFDGSSDSRNALRQALRLAEAEGCWIKVLAVAPSYEGDLELVGVRDIGGVVRGAAEGLLREAEDLARAERGSIMTGLEQGEAYERIVEVAKAENCDLIMMGRRGQHRLERMLMGTVTAMVIGHSPIDVLVVPGGAELGWKNILACTDGSKYSESATERALNHVKARGGRVTVLSVVFVNDEFYALSPGAVESLIEKSWQRLEKIQKKAEGLGVEADFLVRDGEPHQRIIEVAGDRGADVIFMGSHGRTGLRKLLMGSVTEKVVGLADCPVLIVKG